MNHLSHLQSFTDLARPCAEKPVFILIVERRKMMRDLLAQTLESSDLACSVAAFPSAADCVAAARAKRQGEIPAAAAPVIILDAGADPVDPAILIADLRAAYGAQARIVALCPDNQNAVMAAVEAQAQAVAPDSLGLDVLMSIVRLVLAGGTYAPTSMLAAMGDRPDPSRAAKAKAPGDFVSGLTPRQRDVLDALRRGKPNKLIAYELNLCESTVKVHLRSIMQRAGARSRTHLVAMLSGHPGSDRLRHAS